MRHNAQPINPYRILVADHDPQSCMLTAKLLEYYSIEVVAVKGGVDACNAVLKDQKGFDLVIVDINIPIIDGIEFMYVLDRAVGNRRLPVIIQLPYNDDELIVKAIAAGAKYCLPKPYTQRMLFTQVKAALKGRTKSNAYYSKPECNVEAEGTMLFRNFVECDAIIDSLASINGQDNRLRLGLKELMYNAIQHGHLKLAFKKPKIQEGSAGNIYGDTMEKKIAEADAMGSAKLHYKVSKTSTDITIIDNGDGFDWRPYIAQKEMTANDTGRGIYMAKTFAFDNLTYNDKGNEVRGQLLVQPNAG